jgi:hypothetical protein
MKVVVETHLANHQLLQVAENVEKDPKITSKNPDTSNINNNNNNNNNSNNNNNKLWTRNLFDREVGCMNFVLDAFVSL